VISPISTEPSAGGMAKHRPTFAPSRDALFFDRPPAKFRRFLETVEAKLRHRLFG
jgi:hypothetical protein